MGCLAVRQSIFAILSYVDTFLAYLSLILKLILKTKNPRPNCKVPQNTLFLKVLIVLFLKLETSNLSLNNSIIIYFFTPTK